jgi:hypothetical protein
VLRRVRILVISTLFADDLMFGMLFFTSQRQPFYHAPDKNARLCGISFHILVKAIPSIKRWG